MQIVMQRNGSVEQCCSSSPRMETPVSRLRKWLVARLCSIIDNHQVKKEEALIMDVAR